MRRQLPRVRHHPVRRPALFAERVRDARADPGTVRAGGHGLARCTAMSTRPDLRWCGASLLQLPPREFMLMYFREVYVRGATHMINITSSGSRGVNSTLSSSV